MRLWLDLNALVSRQLTVTDVARALRSQNILAEAETLGQSYEIPLRVTGQFKDASEFENLVIKPGTHPTTGLAAIAHYNGFRAIDNK